MSITANEERLIRLADVPKLEWLPRRNGKLVHVCTVFSWARAGINGIRLETVQAAGCKATSEAAIKRFFAALAQTNQHREAAKVERRSRRSSGRHIGRRWRFCAGLECERELFRYKPDERRHARLPTVPKERSCPPFFSLKSRIPM